MLTKHQLTPVDLAGLVAAVFAYNQRGSVTGVIVYDEHGKPINVGFIEVLCETPGLRVRQEPEDTPEDKLKRLAVGAEPVTDPHTVPGPQSINDLAAAQGGI